MQRDEYLDLRITYQIRWERDVVLCAYHIRKKITSRDRVQLLMEYNMKLLKEYNMKTDEIRRT